MKISRLLAVAGILIFACCTAVAEPISVYFSPADSYKSVGSSFTINILADIPQNPGLVDFGFNLVWNQSMMQLNGVTGTGSPWDILWDAGMPESITGLLLPTPTSPPSVYGAGTLLASLDFKCLQEGSSVLDLGFDPALVDLGLQGFYGPDGNALDISVRAGSVDQGTSPVPEPSSVHLLIPIVFGLAIWRKAK